MKLAKLSVSGTSIALLLIQLALVSSIATKYLYQRATCPRVWTRTVAHARPLPIQGRYLSLQLTVDGCQSTLPSALRATFPRNADGTTKPTGFTVNNDQHPIMFRANLKVEKGKLLAIRIPEADLRSKGENVTAMPGSACDAMRLQQPVDFYIAEHAADPTRLREGEELWIEVTVPPKGPPRPLQLALKDNGDVEAAGVSIEACVEVCGLPGPQMQGTWGTRIFHVPGMWASCCPTHPQSAGMDGAHISHWQDALAGSEWPDCCGLIGSGMAGFDVGYEKILAARGAAGEAAQHGQLAHMGERIGNWALEKLLGRGVERRIGGEESVEGLQRLKEAALLFGPWARLRGLPALLPDGRCQRPVKEVAQVRENLHGQAACAVESGKVIGRAFEGAVGPVGNGGQRVAQQFAFLVHRGNYNAFPGGLLSRESGCRR